MPSFMKEYLRKLMPLMLAFVMILSIGFNAQLVFGADGDPVAGEFAGKTVILSTNDVHGAILDYSAAASLKQDYENRGADVILADAGDFTQGDVYVSHFKGANAVELMNLAGYDYCTLGNHEFDFTTAVMQENLSKANFKVLCANILNDDNNPIYQPYDLYDGDVKIGFVGLSTPETQTKSMPSNFIGLHYPMGEEFYQNAQEQIDQLKAAGADVIVFLTHLGVDDESEPYRSIDLFSHTNGIDMILDGHSHTVMEAGPNGEPIMSTGTKFDYIGVTVIDEETKSVEANYLYDVTEDSPRDQALIDEAQNYINTVDEEYGQVIGQSTVDLEGGRGDATTVGNRNGETNTGDLITDAIKWYVMKQGVDFHGVPEQNIVAIQNGGGIRAGIPAGDITRKSIKTVLSFDNTIAAVTVTGRELLEALEASTYSTPGTLGGFPQVSGIKFNINTYKEFDEGDLYEASTYHRPNSINRVEIKEVNGLPFDPDAKYLVLTNNFIMEGGDTYGAFVTADWAFDTGIDDDYAVIEYITEQLGGVIDETYAKAQGRIIINKSAGEAAANTIDEMLPDTITSDDADAVAAAREYYNNLSDEEKAGLPAGTVEKLEAAEAKLEAAEAKDDAAEAEQKAADAEQKAADAEQKAADVEAAAAEHVTSVVTLANDLIKANAVVKSKYKAAGVKKLTAAITAAKAVLAKADATTEEIDKADADLTAAQKALKLKSANPLKATAKAQTVKAKKVKKAKQTLAAIKVTGAKGTVKYAKVKGNKKLTVNAKTGKITVKKGTKKGKYTVRVKVSAAGNGDYKAGSKVVSVKVTVK